MQLVSLEVEAVLIEIAQTAAILILGISVLGAHCCISRRQSCGAGTQPADGD